MNRRSFLATMLATGMAPAVVRAESLMRIVVPSREIIWAAPYAIITREELQKAVDSMIAYGMPESYHVTVAGLHNEWMNEFGPKRGDIIHFRRPAPFGRT